jgi:hypothetical protein
LFIFRGRFRILRIGFDLCEMVEPLPRRKGSQSVTTMNTRDNLGDDFARAFLGERALPRHVGRTLPSDAHLHCLTSSRQLSGLLQPPAGCVGERTIPVRTPRFSNY